jgi:hypothetical protein
MELPNPDPKEGRPKHGGRDRHACVSVKDVMKIKEVFDKAGTFTSDLHVSFRSLHYQTMLRNSDVGFSEQHILYSVQVFLTRSASLEDQLSLPGTPTATLWSSLSSKESHGPETVPWLVLL